MAKRTHCPAGHEYTTKNLSKTHHCRECAKIYNRVLRAKDIAKSMLRKSKAKAKEHGREFCITKADIEPLPENCPVLGLKLNYMAIGVQDCSASIDRIDNRFGYVPGNVKVISYRANLLKRDATLLEMQAIVNYMSQNHPQRP